MKEPTRPDVSSILVPAANVKRRRSPSATHEMRPETGTKSQFGPEIRRKFLRPAVRDGREQVRQDCAALGCRI